MGIVKYRDAFAAGYKVTPISRTNKTSLEVDVGLITDIRLNRDSLDYDYFFNNCLVTVNGYYHRTDTDSVSGLFVLDAMKSLKVSNKNQIGITNFKNIGEITTLSFSEVTKELNNDGTLRFSIPGSLTNKTVMMVYGGHLLPIDNLAFRQINSNVFKLDLSALPLVEMYYESKKYLNFDGVPVEFSLNNENLISLEDLYSDGNIEYFLNMSQSFIVIVNSPRLLFERQYIRTTGLPGQYISYVKPEYPLVLGYGRHVEYWSRYEDKEYSITVNGNLQDRLIFNTFDNANEMSSSAHKEPENGTYFSKGYLLKIYN